MRFWDLGLRGGGAEAPAAARQRVRMKGSLGDIDPLNQVQFKRATRRVKKGPL